MKGGFVSKGCAVLLAALAFVAALGVPASRACDEEGPGFVSVRIDAPLAPENAARIAFELYNGTLAINGIALNGTATWSEGETELLATPVSIVGAILTTGDQATFLDNRGILWLKYRFFDVDGVTIIGTGEGFVTLERVREGEGDGSFQGTITIGGVVKQFAGVGESEVTALMPLAAPVVVADGRDDDGDECEDDLPGLRQEMEKTVITGEKPGFEFETATSVGTVNSQYKAAAKHLTKQRNERLRVIRAVRK
jgi:hypothetical protein